MYVEDVYGISIACIDFNGADGLFDVIHLCVPIRLKEQFTPPLFWNLEYLCLVEIYVYKLKSIH